MTQLTTRLTILTLFCAFNSLQAQLLEVTPGSQPPYNDLPELIRQHLTGAGVDILNVEFTGDPKAVGYFTGGIQSVGLERGLLMSTGSAGSQSGTFGAIGADQTGVDFASTDHTIHIDDSTLSQLAGGFVNDLNRYRITFRPRGDSIRFRYVFASEEYPEYACSPYNDVFGFFLTGPNPDSTGAYNNFNIALVPGTGLPVAINNLHPANAVYPNCPPLNVQFYINNNQSNIQPVYDGLTQVFVAEAKVIPCALYQMTLAIADVSDGVYDSAVFLEANSFGGEPDIAASYAPGDNVIPENAQADTVSLSFTGIPASLLPLSVRVGGTAQNGVDYEPADSLATITTADTVLYFHFQPIPDGDDEGFETITLTASADSNCFTRTFTLIIADPDSIFKPEEVVFLVGGSATLGVAPTSFSSTTLTFTNDTDVAINPANVLVQSGVDVDGLFATLDDVSLIESVCLNIAHAWVDDLDMFLVAPNHRFVELSTDNGVNGDNYTGTCFSPAATTPINFPGPFAPATAAPFTGTFQPEGEWSDILNTPLNGTWNLYLIDDNNGFAGTLLDWSITFSGANLGNFQYLWSTGDTTAELSVTQAGTYQVTVTNSVSSFEKTFIVLPECPFSNLSLEACPGESVTFDSLVLDETHPSGLVTYEIPGDCDSSVYVSLVFFPPAYDSLLVEIGSDEAYEFGGQFLTQTGDYSLTLTAANGCDSIVYLHLEVTTGTQNLLEQSLHIQPNPVTERVLVSWNASASVSRIRVMDANGRLLVESQPAAHDAQATFETASWLRGVYLMVLEQADGAVLRRLVKL